MDLKNKKIAVLKSNASAKVKLAAVKRLDNAISQEEIKQMQDKATSISEDVLRTLTSINTKAKDFHNRAKTEKDGVKLKFLVKDVQEFFNKLNAI